MADGSDGIRTKGLREVLRSIELQVLALYDICHKAQRGYEQTPGARSPGVLRNAAEHLAKTVKSLGDSAESHASHVQISDASNNLQRGCELAEEAARSLCSAIDECCGSFPSPTGPMELAHAAGKALDATTMILTAFEQLEEEKVIIAVHRVSQRFAALLNPPSVKALQYLFGPYTDALRELFYLAKKRSYVDVSHGQKVRSAIETLTATVYHLPASVVQCFNEGKSVEDSEDLKILRTQIGASLNDIIVAVEADMEDGALPTPSRDAVDSDIRHAGVNGGKPGVPTVSVPPVSKTDNGVGSKLMHEQRLSSADGLDKHVRSIVRDSMAVARTCGGAAEVEITNLCEAVESLRQQFQNHLALVKADPNNIHATRQYEEVAQQLGNVLTKLDVSVRQSVVTDPASVLPAKKDIHTGTVQPPLFHPETVVDIRPYVDEFKAYASRLFQVARHAAFRWKTTEAAKQLLSVTGKAEQLVQVIVTEAVRVHSGIGEMEAESKLEELREEWTTMVLFLTKTIDELTYRKQFVSSAGEAMSESVKLLNIALQQNDRAATIQSVNRIQSHAERLVGIARKELVNCEDARMKQELSAAIARIETAIPEFLQAVELAQLTPGDQHLQEAVALHVQSILEGTQNISDALAGAMQSSFMIPAAEASTREQPLQKVNKPVGRASFHTDQHSVVAESPVKPMAPGRTGRGELDRSITPGTKSGPESPHRGQKSHKPAASRRRQLPRKPNTPPAVAVKRNTTGHAKKPVPTPLAKADKLEATHARSSLRKQVSQSGGPRVHFDRNSGGQSSFGQEVLKSTRLHRIESTNRIYRQPIYRHVNWVDYMDKGQRDKATVGQVGLLLAMAALKQDPDVQEVVFLDDRLVNFLQSCNEHSSPIVTGICNHVREHTDRLVKLAKLSIECFSNDDNLDEIRLMRTSISELSRLSPELRSVAMAVCEEGGLALSSPIQTPNVNQLQVNSKLWAQHVQVISTTIDDFIVPWAATAMKLAKMALSEKGSVEAKAPEIRRLTEQVSVMCDAAREAGQADSSMAFASNQEQREAAERNRQVDTLFTLVESLTGDLINAAREAVKTGSVVSAERMHLICREWGVHASRLANVVDEITVGSTRHVSRITTALHVGEGVEESLEELLDFTRELQDVASSTIAGNGEQAAKDKLRASSNAIKSLALALQVTVNETLRHSDRTADGEPNDRRVICMEQLEVRSREWSAKVHTVSCLVDEMTSDVGSPIDRLAGAAVAVSKGLVAEDRVHRIKALRFEQEDIQQRALRVLADVEQLSALSKDRVKCRDLKDCAQQLVEIAPLLIRATHRLADQPDRRAIQQFQHARRRWVSKGMHILSLLEKISDTDDVLIRGIVDDIHGAGYVSEEDELDEQESDHLNLREFGDDILSPIPLAHRRGDGNGAAFSPPRMDQVTSTPHPKGRRNNLPDIDENESLEFTADGEHPSAFASASHWLDDSGEHPPTSKSILIAAKSLHDEADKLDSKNNTLVKLAKKMSQQMYEMAEFTRRRGPIQSKSEMIEMAKKIASDASNVVRYAQNMAVQTTDRRIREELLDCAEVIPTFSTQLSILASVKSAASSPRDSSADAMLVKNAQNLVKTVMRAMRAAQAACMKGLQEPVMEDTLSEHTREMALLWKRQIKQRRSIEKDIAPIGFRGLRRFSRNPDSSSLAELSAADK